MEFRIKTVCGYEEKLDGKRGKDWIRTLLKPTAANYTFVSLTGRRQWLAKKVYLTAERKRYLEHKRKMSYALF
jgi:hypothetical protein